MMGTLGIFSILGKCIFGSSGRQRCSFRPLIAAAMSCGMALTSFAVPAYASDAQELTFRYVSTEQLFADGVEVEEKCYYTDDYFKDSSYKYNPGLATMSLALSMSTFGSAEGYDDYSKKAENAKQLMRDIGMDTDSICANEWFDVKPTRDSIGAIVGHKHIVDGEDEYTLIAIAMRGAGYESEWASNLTIGAEGQHKGFTEAKEDVWEFLGRYISEQDISGSVKMWVTGYSRGGAVANLIGGEIDDLVTAADGRVDPVSFAGNDVQLTADGSDSPLPLAGNDVLRSGNGITFRKEDVFVYCFEPPAGRLIADASADANVSADANASDDANTSADANASADVNTSADANASADIYYADGFEDAYGNIFNIINPSDIVVHYGPAAYGFGRYGIDLCLPSKGLTEGFDAMEERIADIYNSIGSKEYIDSDFHMKKLDVSWRTVRKGKRILVTPRLVINDMANQMSQEAFISDYMTFLANDIIGGREKYADVYEDEIRELLGIVFGASQEQNQLFANSLAARAKNNVGTAARTYRNYMILRLLRGSADRTMLWQLLSDWLNTSLADAGFEDYDAETVDKAGKDLGALMSSLVLRRVNYFVTLMENIEGITQAHYPELCFAWISSMDDNYYPGAKTVFQNQDFGETRSIFAEQAEKYTAEKYTAEKSTDEMYMADWEAFDESGYGLTDWEAFDESEHGLTDDGAKAIDEADMIYKEEVGRNAAEVLDGQCNDGSGTDETGVKAADGSGTDETDVRAADGIETDVRAVDSIETDENDVRAADGIETGETGVKAADISESNKTADKKASVVKSIIKRLRGLKSRLTRNRLPYIK